MHARFILIAAAALTSAAAFAAEPSKPAPQPSAQPQHASPQVVLASAAQVAPAPADPQAQPAAATPKKRVGRVTTCRCGDQLPQPDSGE